MTTKKPSKKELEARILELERELEAKRDLEAIIEKLSVDPAYGIMNRPALDLEISRIKSRAKWVVFLDIDGLHNLNNTLPGKHEEANQKIRKALSIRSEDILIQARWYSGDEIIVILSGEPVSFMSRLKASFALEGLSFTAHYSEYTGELEKDAEKAKSVVDALKASRGITR
jgi:GGDEF domain-containing protein